MAKRITKQAPEQARPSPETQSAWATESHSGEGAASALKTLQQMEEHRDAGRPAEPPARQSD